MARANRHNAHVIEWLQHLQSEPYRYGFLATLRKLECIHADMPRIGESARAKDDPVRFGQDPSLGFAPRPLAAYRPGTADRPGRLECFFFGLFGPNGPLPTHLSEHVHSRELNYNDATARRFADMFHHRLISLFYRASSSAEPAFSYDRPDANRFDLFVGATFGIGPQSLRNRDAMADSAKRYHAGQLSLQTRPAEALVDLVEDYFQLPFRIEEFVGEWLKLASEDRTALSPGRACTLGQDAVLGREIWNCQHRFRLVCGPLTLAEFERLLPGGGSIDALLAVVRNFAGEEFAWDLQLELIRDEVPIVRLGESGRLGWTTWLGERTVTTDADDVCIQVQAAVAH